MGGCVVVEAVAVAVVNGAGAGPLSSLNAVYRSENQLHYSQAQSYVTPNRGGIPSTHPRQLSALAMVNVETVLPDQ